MRYKDIARGVILSRGIHQEIIAEDGLKHHPEHRKFTEKQVRKLNEAFTASSDWLKKKWKLDEE